jgi:Abnormal spindle-like microcephaly-assoc'd, ASPM-SPD-2-Hydin/Protein of unknown function (DUF1573)
MSALNAASNFGKVMKIQKTGLSHSRFNYINLSSSGLAAFILFLAPVIASLGLSGCSAYTAANTQSTGLKTISPSPTSLSFGTVSVGATATLSVTLNNGGTATVTVSQATISGSAFSITNGTSLYSIAAGQSMTLQVRFAPSSSGNATGSLTVTSDASNSPTTINLSGSGAAATSQLTATPNSLNFGNVNVGGTSSLGLTLTNTGNSNVTISGVTTSGGVYAAGGVNANTALTPGQTATLNVTFTPAATGSVSGSVSVASNASNSPATISLTGNGVTQSTGTPGAPTCGISGDTSNHVPTDWGSFVPPAKGQSYVDATFGCTVTRISDASQDDWNGSAYLPITHGYSTVSPFNANDTYLLLSDGWGRRYVTDLKGNLVVPIANMPTGFNDGWFLWDATNPAVFYYTSGNSLMKGTISGSSASAATVHQFSEYAAINFMDETDVSQDGAHVVVIGGDNSGSSQENVFVYNFVANTKGPVYTTSCTGVINNVSNGCLHKLVQTPDNNVAIDFASDGSGPEQGLRLWSGTFPLVTLQDLTDHMDTGYDLNGNAVFVESGNSFYTAGLTNPCPSGWGLDVRQLNNPTSAVCLLDNLPSWHVGYRGNKNQPWVVLSFDDQQTRPSPQWFDNNGSYAAPTSSNWHLYDDEIMVLRVDANNNPANIYRLARGYSRTDEDFNAQLKGAISRDGKYVAFDSNMAYAHTGCPANFQTATNCSDVYVIKVQ